MSAKRHMHMGVFVLGTGNHSAGWRYEGAFTSMAHGWSTGVLPALTNELLGAAPTSAGFATWQVTPHPGTVTWAAGRLATTSSIRQRSRLRSSAASSLTRRPATTRSSRARPARPATDRRPHLQWVLGADDSCGEVQQGADLRVVRRTA